MPPSPSSSSSAHSSSSSSSPGPYAAGVGCCSFTEKPPREGSTSAPHTGSETHTHAPCVCVCVSDRARRRGPAREPQSRPRRCPPPQRLRGGASRGRRPPRVRNTGHRDNDGARRRGRPGLGAGVPSLPCGGRGRPAVAVAAGGGEGGGGAGPAAGRRGEAELAAARPAGAGEPARRRFPADVDHLQQRVLPGPRKLVERPGADCRGHLRGSHTDRRVAGAPRAAGERDGGGGGASGPRPGEQTPRGWRAFSCGGGGRAED